MTLDVLASVSVMVLLLAFFYGPWQTICTDVARQLLFEQRDALFDMAASGDIAFDAVEYRAIRQSLNDMVRYLHKSTLPRLIILEYMLRDIDDPQSRFTGAALRIEDQATRRKVRAIERTAFKIVLFSLAARSAVLWILALLIVPALALAAFAALYRSSIVARAKRAGEFAVIEAEMFA